MIGRFASVGRNFMAMTSRVGGLFRLCDAMGQMVPNGLDAEPCSF